MTPNDIFDAAVLRYGAPQLRNRMRGAPDDGNADLELLKIAHSVFNRVQGAASQSIGWPLPGRWPDGSISPTDGSTDISDHTYDEIWPADLMERALQLFNGRTFTGMDQVPPEQMKVWKAAETWFDDFQSGAAPIGIISPTAPRGLRAAATRDRSGRSNVPGVSDTTTIYEDRFGNAIFSGRGWDRSR